MEEQEDLWKYINESYKKRISSKIIDEDISNAVSIFSILENIKSMAATRDTKSVKSQKLKLIRSLIKIKEQRNVNVKENALTLISNSYGIRDCLISTDELADNSKRHKDSISIIYGPPLSGKTFLQERLNQKALIIDSDGFFDFQDIIDSVFWKMTKGEDIYIFTNRHEWITETNLSKILEEILPFKEDENIHLKFLIPDSRLIMKAFENYDAFNLSWINISDLLIKINRFLMVGQNDWIKIIGKILAEAHKNTDLDVTVQFVENVVL